MKFKPAVIAVPVVLIMAAVLIFIYTRSQKPIVINEQPMESSQPIEIAEPVVSQPEIEIPLPDDTLIPVQEDAITPETILPPESSAPAINTSPANDGEDETASQPPQNDTDAQTPVTSEPAGIEDNTPTGGETNNGKIYVPGFGWLDDPGSGSGQVTVGEHSGTGDIIGY